MHMLLSCLSPFSWYSCFPLLFNTYKEMLGKIMQCLRGYRLEVCGTNPLLSFLLYSHRICSCSESASEIIELSSWKGSQGSSSPQKATNPLLKQPSTWLPNLRLKTSNGEANTYWGGLFHAKQLLLSENSHNIYLKSPVF